jgi:PAS domain S-box-containing protein
MDRRLHDMRNDLAVAIGTVHALIDGKLPATPERLHAVLDALESLDGALTSAPVSASAPAKVTAKEHLLNAVIEGSPYAKILVDDRGKIVLVNAQTEALFGYTREELFGQSIEMLVPQRFRYGHPALRSHFTAAPIARAMGAGRDLYGRRKDGSEVPIEIGLNPIGAESETFTLAAVTDITERKRAEELRLVHAGVQQHAAELEELNRELERVSRFKTEFVATMSHELRTPLSAIIGAAELLEREPLAGRSRSVVTTIAEASQALMTIVNTVLDFSKIEAGKLELQTAPFAIDALVGGAAEVAAQLAREKGLRLQTEVDAQIPPVAGDRDRLRQVLLNLLGNAVKFTERGDITLRADLVASEGEAVRVRFEIEDAGIGIAGDVMATLFEPFAQADRSTSRRFGGTGLGLSISKRLVELMGGEIGVSSELGRGSTFWFVVPFRRARELQPAGIAAAGPGVRDAPRGAFAQPERVVLVAEDNQQLAELLKLQFDELGVPVAFVTDGRQALEAVASATFAMVFMDCQMPNLDGLDATRLIRAEERTRGGHIPIAAMTANAFAEDRAACMHAGMDDYLAKPVKLAELRALIARWTR